jgi:protein-disulfide isomerase
LQRVTAARLSPPLGPDDHVQGPEDAPLELVMYGDFQCPYCVAAQSMVRRVRERLDGHLRFAFRHMPLGELHPDAHNAAEAAEAAAARGAFWPMHDQLYASRGRLSLDDLADHAAAIGVEAQAARDELASHIHAPRVARDEESARRTGISGTPAFFVNGTLHEGAFDAGSLVQALQASAPSSSAS